MRGRFGASSDEDEESSKFARSAFACFLLRRILSLRLRTLGGVFAGESGGEGGC